MAKESIITIELVRKFLDYDPETGIFLWRWRSAKYFSTKAAGKIWNSRFPKTVAGTPDGKGYFRVRIFGVYYKSHHLAWLYMTGEWPENHIDHKNLNKSDNRWNNLRIATASQNQANRRAGRNNTSGFKGVSWSKQAKKWRSRFKKDGKETHIGYFDTPEDASLAYSNAAKRIHGEFARS